MGVRMGVRVGYVPVCAGGVCMGAHVHACLCMGAPCPVPVPWGPVVLPAQGGEQGTALRPQRLTAPSCRVQGDEGWFGSILPASFLLCFNPLLPTQGLAT